MKAAPLGLVAGVDLVCVLVFAAVGRASHGEDVGPAGLVSTAAPFAVGWLVGWTLVLLLPAARRRPSGLPAGALVWVPTVAVGMLVRALTGAGVQTPFVVVAAVVLAVFLLGWRGVRLLARRPRPGTRAEAEV